MELLDLKSKSLNRQIELPKEETNGSMASHGLDHIALDKYVATNQEMESGTASSTSSHLASPQYVHQFHAMMDSQRQLFHAEHQLWQIERTELHERIAQLEASLCRYRTLCVSQVSSPTESNGSRAKDPPHVENANELKSAGTGDEFWRGSGGKRDAQPVRIFPSSSDTSSKVEDRWTIVARDPLAHKSGSAAFPIITIDSGILSKTSLRGIEEDKNLDGITFRKSSLALTITESLVMPPSSSPPQLSLPTGGTAGTVSLPSSRLTAPCDPYTKDAGHTPLAPRSEYSSYEDLGADLNDLTTPTQPEIELSPLDPPTSVVKVPSESADSYFPNLDELKDGDIELREPLGLKNNGVHDENFLSELDSKLLKAATSEKLRPESTKLGKENIEDDEKIYTQADQEPKLRIKRSMNFGSQFGTCTLGKGF